MSALKQRTDCVRIVGGGGHFDPAILFADPSDRSVLVPEHREPAEYAPVDTVAEVGVLEVDGRVSQVLDFLIDALTPVRDVMAIIAESTGTPGAVHLTVFADPVSSDTRERVYGVEQQVLDKFPSMAFDFHLRAPERVSGRVVVPPAPQALVLWHRMGADAECP